MSSSTIMGDGKLAFDSKEVYDLPIGSQLRSPCVEINNLPWQILLMHRDKSGSESSSLGFYLQCNADSTSTRWSVYATAELRLLHPTNHKLNKVKGISHSFSCKSNDWGFGDFLAWEELHDKGYLDEDQILRVEVDLKANPPHGVGWNSKQITGFVGLENQGATCYMNSLLQALYFTNKLRKAVYGIPTESADNRDVALALQRVFYQLQTYEKAVETKKLTRSFGWRSWETFMQHDVQELSRVLLDKLEEKMKGTEVGGVISKLFQGKMESYIKCKSVDYKSSRIESFYDIQLKVKGISDLLSSFKDYVATELLDGDNKYFAEGHGLQDAEKGVRFVNLPPVLHLQLRRFQYDPQTESNTKINDKFEFPEVLDLTSLSSDLPKYRLQSVLVHAGDNRGGHYIAYINPTCGDHWFRFDDDIVSRCSREDAIDGNYGGYDAGGDRLYSSAYMLVYVRCSDVDDVLCNVDEGSIPFTLLDRLRFEQLEEEHRQQEIAEAHLYQVVRLVLEDHFDRHSAPDLCSLRSSNHIKVRVLKTCTVLQLVEEIGDHLNIDRRHVRLWPLQRRTNDSFRPLFADIERHGHTPIEDLEEFKSGYVFVETCPPDALECGLVPYDKDHQVCLFVKRYCARTGTLQYCMNLIMSISDPLTDLEYRINQQQRHPKGCQLILYEEIDRETVELLPHHNLTLGEAIEDVMSGDIIIFQRNDRHINYAKLPTPEDYLRWLRERLEIDFEDRHSYERFTMELSQRTTYEELSTAVARHLRLLPDRLQFYLSTREEGIGFPVKAALNQKLKDIFELKEQEKRRKLYYRTLTVPISVVESKLEIKCKYLSAPSEHEVDVLAYIEHSATVLDLLEEIKKKDLPGVDKPLRLLEILNGRISCVSHELKAVPLPSYKLRLRVEPIALEEEQVNDDIKLVPCAHYHNHVGNLHGTPFLVMIKEGEPLSCLRDRIKHHLQISDQEFCTYGLSLVVGLLPHNIEQADFDDPKRCVLLSDFTSKPSPEGKSNCPDRWIGINHPSKSRKRKTYTENAIRIY